MPSCFVKTCRNSEKTKTPGLSFHRFPAKIKAEWLLALGLPPDVKMRHTSVICSQHFRDSDYLKYTKYKFLRDDVIPSVNLPTKRFVFSNSKASIDSEGTNSLGSSFTTNDSSSYSSQEIQTINMIISNLHSYCRRFSNTASKTTLNQYKIYLAALENDPVFNAMENNVMNHLDGDSDFYSKWMKLTEKLNSVNGPKRSWDKWKKKFADWKLKTRNKYLEMIKDLSNLEAKALYLWGSPEGTNLLLKEHSEEMSDPAETSEDEQSSFQCFLSTGNDQETNNSNEESDSGPFYNHYKSENEDFEDTKTSEDAMEIKYADLIKNHEHETNLHIKSEVVDDFEIENNEMNGLLQIKTEDLSDLELEDVMEDENISTEDTPYVVDSMSSCSNSTSREPQESRNIFNSPPIEKLTHIKTEENSPIETSTEESSQIRRSKRKKGKVFYVQIEKIS